jgi:hypothetical protein
MLRTVGDQPTLWEAILPEELRRLPAELARVDVLLDDPVFFAPFVPLFDPADRSAVDTGDTNDRRKGWRRWSLLIQLHETETSGEPHEKPKTPNGTAAAPR